MRLLCIEAFKSEIENLKSKKPYRDIERDVIEHFIGKNENELASGTRLNGSSDTPYIKKRLGGSGGYRIYYLLIIKDNAAYLMFIHPKTGPAGTENLTPERIKELYKTVLEAITNNDLFEVTAYNKHALIFTKA